MSAVLEAAMKWYQKAKGPTHDLLGGVCNRSSHGCSDDSNKSVQRVPTNERMSPSNGITMRTWLMLFITSLLYSMMVLCFGVDAHGQHEQHSVARQWNEALLLAIRNDLARPPVHARNLFHVSAAMWDAWAAYDRSGQAIPWLYNNNKDDEAIVVPGDADQLVASRNEAISHAAYRLLVHRFADSPGRNDTLTHFDTLLEQLGYFESNDSTLGDSASALGNRIANTYIEFGLQDGSNEANDYTSRFYSPINPPLFPDERGNPTILDPDRWQPLSFGDVFVDQSGNAFSGATPSFQSPEWGRVTPFSLGVENMTRFERDDQEYWVYSDPGPPPFFSSPEDVTLYKAGFEQVVLWSGLLDPEKGQSIDISPASRGNNTLGTNDGNGYEQNPVTGRPYEPQVVPAGDYYRVLAEFWADGPDSETPPGHWFAIVNAVSDHPDFVPRIKGKGPVLDTFEWDVKVYFTLGGAMHDAAIAAWSTKGWYDYVRPISAIRYMAGLGQCSDPDGMSYHPDGINLFPGVIEVITNETVVPGGRHAHLAGYRNAYVGKIAVYAWRGPDYIIDPGSDTAGVGWIFAEDWWPYQRPSFVTPPFAGYVSGHSTFSRAAARTLTDFTGSEFFPGGMAEFEAPQDNFLVFEKGPSVDITLQWARYFDAADECSISRVYGGIHPTADDIPGRLMGDAVGKQAVREAFLHFSSESRSSRNFLLLYTLGLGVAALGVCLVFIFTCWRKRTRDPQVQCKH